MLANLQKAQAASVDYADHLYVLNKDLELVRYVPKRAQLDYRQHKTGRDLLLKARQLGFSTEIQSTQFVQAISKTSMCATLAHDDATTQKLRRMAARFYEYLPANIRPDRGLDNATTTTYPATGSEVTITKAGSTQSGRGGTYSNVHGSEVAFWPDAEKLMAGILQGVPTSGVIELESSPNGAQGWFYDRCMEALDGNSDWTLHFYAWYWEDDDYKLPLERGERLIYTPDEQQLVDAHQLRPEQIKWRRSKQRELGRLFLQEYPEDPVGCFLTSGTGYFGDIADLNRVFSAPLNAAPIAHHRYVAALDFGQASDRTALSVIDATTLEEVELWYDSKKPWSDMRARVLASCSKWHVESLHPETNSMGGTNIEELHREFRIAGCRTTIQPFTTTAQSKPPMVTAFHWALDEGGLKLLPDPVGKAEIHAYSASQTPSGQWKYEGLPHDDTVIARMGAWNGVVSGRGGIGSKTTNPFT